MQTLAAAAEVFHSRLRRLSVDLDAPLLVLGHDLLLHHRVEWPQKRIMPDEEMRLRAEGIEHARHLHSYVARPDERRRFRLGLEIEEAIGRYAELLRTGYVVWDVRVTPGGDERVLRLDDDLLLSGGRVVERDAHRLCVEEGGASVQVLDLIVVEVTFVDAVQPFDVGVALLLESWPVEGGGLGGGEAVGAGFVSEGVGDGGGVPSDLLGYAAVDEY